MLSSTATPAGALRLAPARRRAGVAVTAAAGGEHQAQQASRQAQACGHPQSLRVLRYPSGEERVIRYSGDGETLSTGPAVSGAPVAPAGYYASRGARHTPPPAQSPPAQRPSPSPGLAVPDTPAALARVATSSLASGLSRAVATAASALTVYTPTTNTGAPPQHLPATCFLLAHAPADDADGHAVMVTLPTRCAGQGLDFAPSLEIAHMRDGVLAFPTHDAAAAYGDELAADGADDVNIMGVDTAQLFQLALDSDACVVWFRPNASEAPPRPAELAMVLRAHGW